MRIAPALRADHGLALGPEVFGRLDLQPTREARDATIGFGAVELGLQTLGKLAASLGVE